MTYSNGRMLLIAVFAVALTMSSGQCLFAQEGVAKKAAGEAFNVQCRVITYFDDGERDTLTSPTIVVLESKSGTISVGSEKTITVAPKTTEAVFVGTSISVKIRKGAKGKYMFDIEGTRSSIESDGLRHTQVKKRSNRVVSPLELDHKFIVPMRAANKTDKAIDLEFTVKRAGK